MGAWRLRAACVGVALCAAGCDGGAYTVVVRFDPPALAESAGRVEVALVDGCAGLATTGEAPAAAATRLELRRGERAGSLAPVAPGDYGLYARAWSGDCQVVAAGCAAVSLEAGGSGELSVALRAVSGPGCAPGSRCEGTRCAGADGGGIDGGGIDGGPTGDAGIDAGPVCGCADCATCDPDGACVPDHGSCGAGAFCHPADGCVAGTPCPSDGSPCPDDGDACTRVDCALEPPICVASPVPDATACALGPTEGLCRSGACCTGCWAGGACAPGTDAASCGSAGAACVSCDDGDPCTVDTCVAGLCMYVPDDGGACPGGVCHGGACCTGCWAGGVCLPGDTAAVCGAAGAPCAACDRAACPPQQCMAAGCDSLGATSIAANRGAACAIAPDSSLWCWGRNLYGELGLGDAIDRREPARVGAAADWASVARGSRHTCALKSDGRLFCWGRNSGGQLGLGASAGTGDVLVPTRVGTATSWASVTCGESHSCALRRDGSLWCWGDNAGGAVGAGPLTVIAEPLRVGTASDWTLVASLEKHTCALRGAGLLFCWGENRYGELGLGDLRRMQATPARVGMADDWVAVATGKALTCALRSDASRWCWGRNRNGQVGDGTLTDRLTPLRADTGRWRSVTPAKEHVCGVRPGGSLYCWGRNDSGQLGQGPGGPLQLLRPTQVGTLTAWAAVAGGASFTCALRTDGSVWCWGRNDDGSLGDRTIVDRFTPTRTCL